MKTYKELSEMLGDLYDLDDMSHFYDDSKVEGSSKTSRKQIAGAMKKIPWQRGESNFDVGGGKFNLSTKQLATYGVTNFVYDPYNRGKAHNKIALNMSDTCKTSTIMNVLNVIPELRVRLDVIRQAKRAQTEEIYISVYEGKKTGVGGQTRDGWQNQRELIEYLPEVKKIYPQAKMWKYGMIRVLF